MMATKKSKEATSPACYICTAAFAVEGAAEPTSTSRRHPATAYPRNGLDASFVDISYSHYPPSDVDGNICDISDHAPGSSHINTARKDIINGADMYEASRRMDIFLESALNILSVESNGMEGDISNRKYFCQSCLER